MEASPIRLDGRTIASWAILGVFNSALYLGLSYTGMQTVSSAFTAVLISANPLLTALIAGPVLGERLSPLKLGGLLLGMLGVAIVLRSRLSGGLEDWRGTLLVLAGLVALVAGTILFKKMKPGGDLWTGTAIQSLSAGILLLPIALATESLGDIRLTAALVGGWSYLVIAASIGGYLLWFRLLQTKTATEATSLHFLLPPLGLAFGKAGGRLVHDDEAARLHQRANNFRHLALARRQPRSRPVERQIRRDARRDVRHLCPHGAAIDERSATGMAAADPGIADSVEMRNQIQFLMDEAEAQRLCGARAVDGHVGAVEANRPGIRLVEAGQRLDQRRFAGAIFADKRMHRPRAEREIGMVESFRRAEMLDEAAQREKGIRCHGQVTPSVSGVISFAGA